MTEKTRKVEVDLTDDDIRHAEQMLEDGDYEVDPEEGHVPVDDAGERGYR
jgi:hypothetical protein